MGEPGTPSSGSNQRQRRRNFDTLDTRAPDSSPFTSSGASPSFNRIRSVRRRVEFDHQCKPLPRSPAQADAHSQHQENELLPTTELVPHSFEFLVYLPNRTSVELRVSAEACRGLTAIGFVTLVQKEFRRRSVSTKERKQEKRGIVWGDHVEVRDFQGNPIRDGQFASRNESKTGRVLLLYDNHPDTVHAHDSFWNVTPEPHMLEVLPQDYTLFSALADELDNSLQAVYQLQPGQQRLICVNLDHRDGKISIYDTGKGMDGTPGNCIAKWGTLGSSMNRHMVSDAVGGDPPYLKPNFGMYGFGGISAGFHLGGRISVSSKTERSQRVAILHMGRKSLAANVRSGCVWKTGGEFRSPTAQELQWSPHGSFTKVEIADLHHKVSTWKVEEVQRKLKDYYFPYIQNDEGVGESTITTRPVEIRINGEDLATVLGGEVTHSNYHSSPGDPFQILLGFSKPKDKELVVGDTSDRANARIICHYFPINKGREAIDDIICELREEDPDFAENFESFSRRAVRRLGRLLPDARGGRLPFMEPKKVFRFNEVNRHCYKRAKAFIDVDAGFIPTQSKMDLVPKNAFTEALLNLGLGLQTPDTAKLTLKKSAPVAVSIQKWDYLRKGWAATKPEHLHAEYTTWITGQHERFDVEAVYGEGSSIIVAKPGNKKELNFTKDVFRVLYDINSRGIDWKVGKDLPPIHLKLLKGLSGLNNGDKSMFVTVECFVSEGFPDELGDLKIICRPMEIPEERGSVEGLGKEDQLPYFVLGESRAFPIDILFSDKCDRIPEAAWQKRLEVTQKKLPAFIELLNEQDALEFSGHQSLQEYASLEAGASLPSEIIAVVRPSSRKAAASETFGKLIRKEAPRVEQKHIIADAMEMTLGVREMKKPEGAVDSGKVYEAKITATARKHLKGLYCFNTTGTILESMTRTTGIYEFTFTLVSTKYQAVDEFKVCINVTPSSNVGRWNICSHPGLCCEQHQNRSPEVMTVRLGEALPGSLYLTRVDEFSNPMEFTEVPADIDVAIFSAAGERLMADITVAQEQIKISEEDNQLSLEIPTIEVDGGDLEPFKPTMQASLRMSIANSEVASFSISVLPGEIASAHVKDGEAPENRLKPGQIIEQMVFQAFDRYQNPVSDGEKVQVLLQGFEFQDKLGFHMRPMNESGSLDLGMVLRVTSGYGELARVELRSTEEKVLCERTFDIIDRKLRAKCEPDSAPVGSQLTGIIIEAVDEDERVDESMDGRAHFLELDWNPSIAVQLHQGRCTLPPIQLPNDARLWSGCVAHTLYPKLRTVISVWVEEKESGRSGGDGDSSGPDEQNRNKVRADGSEILALPHQFSGPLRASLPRKVLAIGIPSPGAARPQPQPQPQPDAPERKQFNWEAELQQSATLTSTLEIKLRSLEKKVRKHETDLAWLTQVKKDHEDSLRRYQAELEDLEKGAKCDLSRSGAAAALEDELNHDPIPFALTPAQVEVKISGLGHPPGTHAAAIFLQAQRERHRDIVDAEGVLGVVALLGAVEGETLNRALVEFLGPENMLAIICGSTSAAEAIGIPHSAGALHQNKGLSGFAHSRNLRISGRYRVITLTDDSSFFKSPDKSRASVNDIHPQRLLNIGPGVIKPGCERSVGSLGYAVNLIVLSKAQLKVRVAGHGLRESLFFMLFGYLEVFDTATNMMRARNSIRTTAVSLDGGLIRARNQFELGSREDPSVWFPSAQTREQRSGASPRPEPARTVNCVSAKHEGLKQRIQVAEQRYSEGRTEEDLRKAAERLTSAQKKLAGIKQQLQSIDATAVGGATGFSEKAALPAPRPPGGKFQTGGGTTARPDLH